MKRLTTKSFSAIVALCLAAELVNVNSRAAVQAWDPNGTTSVGGNGIWDTNTANWTPPGTQAQVASGSLKIWDPVGTNAAVFCAGPAGSTSQGNFTITVPNAVPMGGIFNGSLTPGPCSVTLVGPGSLNITPASSGVATFSTLNSSVGNTTINIPITGTSRVNCQSTGQLFLNGTNTYTGGTFLGYSSGGFTGILNFAGPSSFGTGNLNVSNTLGGICALVAESTSAQTITNKITWSTLGGGVNIVGNPAGITFSGTVALAATQTNANLFAGGTGNLVIMSGVISGGNLAGHFNKGNASTLRLSAANIYLATTTVSNGVLQAGIATAIPNGTNRSDLWVYNPGVFDVNGFGPTCNGLYGDGVVTNSSATAGTLSVGGNATNSTFNGTITSSLSRGALSLTKISAGTFTMAGTGTYTGNTTVNGGTFVALNGNTAIPSSSLVTVALGANLDVNNNNMTFNDLTGRGNIINNSGTLTLSNSVSTTNTLTTYDAWSGNVDSGALIKTGNSSAALRGTNNFQTGVEIDGGTLSVGAGPDRISTFGGAVLTIANGATFQLDAATQTIAQISGSGAINLGGGTLNVNTPLGNTYSGVIRDSDLGANPIAQGHGLRGYYYDNQDMSSLFAVRDDAQIYFPDFTTNFPAGLYTNQVSVRWLGQVLAPVDGTYTFTVASDDGSRLWVNGILVEDNWVTQSGTARNGTIALAANTRYDIVLEYFNQTGGASCQLRWTPPNDTGSSPIPSDYLFLPTAGSLVKDGAGSLQLTAANNTYTGSTVVNNGTLQISADNGLGSGNVYVNAGAVLTLDTGAGHSFIADSADLVLASSSTVNLNFSGTDTVRSLSLDGGTTYVATGTYGSIGSGAQHPDSHFNGTGLIRVAGLPSTTTLNSSAATTVYGTSVTFTAVAHGTGATPTGTITFFDGANAIGTVAVDGTGTALLNVSSLSVLGSPHSVTAVYNGDLVYGTSTSAAVTQTVTPITLSGVTGVTKQYDQTTTAPLNLTNLTGVLAVDTNLVQIAAGYTATYSDKNVGVGKAVTASGIALTGAAAGNYTIASTANTIGNINPKPLTVTNSTASNKVYDGTTAATVNASAAGITGLGTNIIYATDDATPNYAGATGVFASPNVANGITVTVTVPLTGADGGNYIATGVPKANITQATSSLALSSSANPANAGDNVSFTATATPLTGAGVPGGNVNFLTNGVLFATVPLAGGSANSGITTSLPQGTNTITAQYAGDVNFVGNTNSLQQVINASTVSQPTMTIGQAGQSITISWTGNFILQSVNALQSSGTGWQAVPGATSPYTTTTTNSSTFYRLSN